jgi:hypothetical protein
MRTPSSDLWRPLAGVLLVLAATLASPAHAAPGRQVYLITMHPGDALFTGFGHLAFRIRDDEQGTDDVYDYGTYDADDPLLGWKFLVGTLPYYCQHTSFADMVNWYQEDFGGIVARELNLTPAQIDGLVSRVTHDCLPENAAYAYHHFYNNCATKLRDILDELLAGELSRSTRGKLAGRSLRNLIDASMARWEFAVTRWAVFGLLNGDIDTPADRWEQMFLPYYLSVELDELQQPALAGRPPLVTAKTVIVGDDSGPPELPSPVFGILFTLLLVGLGLFPVFLPPPWSRRMAGAMVLGSGALGGLYGSVLAFSWAVSPYPETAATATLMLLHPLHWFLVPAGLGVMRGNGPWQQRTAVYLRVGVVVAVTALGLNLGGLITQQIWLYAVGSLAVAGPLALTLAVMRRRRG